MALAVGSTVGALVDVAGGVGVAAEAVSCSAAETVSATIVSNWAESTVGGGTEAACPGMAQASAVTHKRETAKMIGVCFFIVITFLKQNQALAAIIRRESLMIFGKFFIVAGKQCCPPPGQNLR